MKSIKNVINMLKPGISLALNDIKDDFYCLNISWTLKILQYTFFDILVTGIRICHILNKVYIGNTQKKFF